MKWKSLLFLVNLSILSVSSDARLTIGANTTSPTFDLDLYKEVLNLEQCQRQLTFMTRNNNLLLAQFLDAGIRLPRGFFEGNTEDFGNYHQCLGIDVPFEETNIAGKYCVIKVPLSQDFNLPGLSAAADALDLNSLKLGLVSENVLDKYYMTIKAYRALSGSSLDDRSNPFFGAVLTLAICIPKVCSTENAINGLLFNVTALGFQYDDEFCRLPDDKPWVLVDYVAIVIFSIIGCLTILSSAYELISIFPLKRDPKSLNIYLRSFSVYNNTRRLLSFSEGADSLKCLEGIRTLATIWVIIGHAFSTVPSLLNPTTAWTWLMSAEALWITTAPITVDTFFVITGILLVFTTAKKMDGMMLVRNIHLFYLRRLLRMFPLLATAVLLDASIFHKVADGPHWTSVATNANRCRAFWWTTLLQLQNYLNPREMCIPHSWYIAIDIQLHILSPLLLFWLLGGGRRRAWSALLTAFSFALGGSAIYNYFLKLPSHTVVPARLEELMDYMTKYYFHIMSRLTPFIVGMIFGYVLHLWRGKKVKINKFIALCLWTLSFGAMGATFYMMYSVQQLDWSNQAIDTAMNTLMRPVWAVAIGWIVLASAHGYGGPISWFLSIPMWQLPGRLSYGMYLFHYPIMFVASGTALAPLFFSVTNIFFQSLSHLMLSFMVSFVLTVVIDAPFTIIFKRLLDKPEREQNKPKKLDEATLT